MSEPYFTVEHLFGRPDESGGGLGCRMGRRKRLADAIAFGADRLFRNADPSPHDRILIKRRKPGGEHPTWLYRDGDGRVCMWRRHASQRFEAWGYAA